MKQIVIIFLLAFFLTQGLTAQSKKEFKSTFIEADSYYLYGEYDFANSLFLILYDQAPDNDLLAYKVGNCYLNTPFEKGRAIDYLEQAIRNTDYDANEKSFKETRAPLDAYFALGNAYRIVGDLDNAIATYQKFKSMLTEENEMMNADFIDQQIDAAYNARELMEEPVLFIKQNQGSEINLASVNFRPVVSGDETVMVYTCKFGEDNRLYYTRKENGRWLPPEDITEEIGSDNDCESSCLNGDGTELYVYKLDDFIGNIYVSRYVNDTWTPLEKLNNNINTKYFESHAAISNDGNTLYFASNREGGYGELDLYMSFRDSEGEWGEAMNMGPTINTRFNETAPFITMNDSSLYFSSEGHRTMGGFDIFKSTKLSSGWSMPENMGYPVNTTDNDLFFNPVANGKAAYQSRTTGYKSKDIYRISFELPVITVDGTVSVQDTNFKSFENIYISVIDTTNQDTIKVVTAENTTGLYEVEVGFGDYQISYEGSGFPAHYEYVHNTVEDFKESYTFNVRLLGEFKPIIASEIPRVDSVAQEDLVKDYEVTDLNIVDREGKELRFYAVQLMALINPVDVSYFHERGFEGTKILFGQDEFYRYIYGEFETPEEAERVRQLVVKMGYLDVFVKKVFQETLEQNVIREKQP